MPETAPLEVVGLTETPITMPRSMGTGNRTPADIAKLRDCLDRILAGSFFVQSDRQQRFLKFIVSETLAGRTDRLEGYTIAVEVFDRDASFDPAVDAIAKSAAVDARQRGDYRGRKRSLTADQAPT
jgi:hypothetical protein